MSSSKRSQAAKKAALTRKRRAAAKKAADKKAENYAKANAEEKARIDEVRRQAAFKAAETKRLQKKKGKGSFSKISKIGARSVTVERAENTGKAAVEITKWRINQLDIRPKWQLVEFMGKKGKESAGIVDILAIRKDHKKLKIVGFKPGDLFEIMVIQVKGGGARWPSKEEINRLQRVAEYYIANDVVLCTWKNEQLVPYHLKNLDYRKKLNPHDAWKQVSSLEELFT